MKYIDILRALDRLLGDFFVFIKPPKCVLREKTIKSKAIRRILVIKFWGLGSILLMTPTLKALKTRYPQAEITILTLEQNKKLCERINLIDHVVTVPMKKYLSLIPAMLKLISRLRKERFEVALDFEFLVNISALLAYLSRANLKVGFRSETFSSRNKLYERIVEYKTNQHVSQNFAELVKPLNIHDIDYSMGKIEISRSDMKKIGSIRRDLGLIDKTIVCVNINAGELAIERRWPKERFEELIKNILTRYRRVAVVLIGSKSEEPYVRSLEERLKNRRVVNLAGKINLAQLQLLFEKTSLFITNDSGPNHIAALVKTKTICFFGPETPKRYGPLNENSTVIYKKIRCSPCMNMKDRKKVKCSSNAKCIRDITVNDVFKKVKLSLKE
jgi:lipopolysaccharide heptosyltransferase II